MTILLLQKILIEVLIYSSNLQLVGTLFDITGAYYLSRAFIFKSPLEIKFETYGTGNSRLHTSFGMSGNLFMSFYTQGMEARIGFGLLLIGFLCQASGILWPSFSIPFYATLVAWTFGIIFAYILRRILNNPARVKRIHDRRES